MRTVFLTTANQGLSKLVREVERGEGFLITRRGRPVAKLVPPSTDKASDPEWAAAHRRMMIPLEGGGARRAQDRTAALHDRR